MDLNEFRRLFPERHETVAGHSWGIIETRGQPGAPALVMLPGTLGTAQIFWHQIAALGERLRIVSVTYPPLDEIVPLADALRDLLDHLKIERASILGSSLGGYLTQWFAVRHPQRVEQIFIGNSLSDPKIVNPARKTAAELRQLPGEAHQAIVLGSVETWSEPEPVFAFMKSVLRESGRKFISADSLKARVLLVAGGGEVPQVNLPGERVTIIDCEDDPLIPAAGRDDVVRRYPGATLLRLPVGGHYPYITRPETYNAMIAQRLLPEQPLV
jgi:pimeloyl-ACP methyl ester carboxylesterase